ncbi:hypothetical protein BU16DRAFT_526213 [Lophium mytilinum]|uniref:DUF7053 domain-containing protein n=1 Tax=Lophium mytilinum TaxID=390894 RepID=A0A6A6QXK7_9PEZI|nr:hypothetical protein BU16DRAFT_526213 [Lophium mytilinum]
MHTLPRGLWDTTVSFTAEMTNIENGLEWVIKAPMGLVQTSFWRIVPAEERDKVEEPATELVIVEDVEIKASRLLVGTVKGKCESNYKGIHAKFLAHLKELEA